MACSSSALWCGAVGRCRRLTCHYWTACTLRSDSSCWLLWWLPLEQCLSANDAALTVLLPCCVAGSQVACNARRMPIIQSLYSRAATGQGVDPGCKQVVVDLRCPAAVLLCSADVLLACQKAPHGIWPRSTAKQATFMHVVAHLPGAGQGGCGLLLGRSQADFCGWSCDVRHWRRQGKCVPRGC